MRMHTISPLELQASAIGMGTMIFHPDTQDRDFALLDAYVASGGTYIDTAEVYGAVEEHGYSEMVIGRWLAARPGMRESIILASKGLIPGYCAPLHEGGAAIDPDSIRRAISGSLERLQSECLDIWMFHRDDPKLPVGPLIDTLDDEVRAGRLRCYGASNWTTGRIQEANDYARSCGKAEMMISSPNFSLARANEPFWPDTVSVGAEDIKWHAQGNFPLVAWSALGRGFFAKGDPADRSDEDLARTFYSDGNFERKRRAALLAEHKGFSMFEVALAYVISQPFPVIALNGAQTPAEVESSARAGSLELAQQERDWIDLSSDTQPF